MITIAISIQPKDTAIPSSATDIRRLLLPTTTRIIYPTCDNMANPSPSPPSPPNPQSEWLRSKPPPPPHTHMPPHTPSLLFLPAPQLLLSHLPVQLTSPGLPGVRSSQPAGGLRPGCVTSTRPSCGRPSRLRCSTDTSPGAHICGCVETVVLCRLQL